MDIALGIDIGGTNTKIGIVNREGEILQKTSLPTSSENLSHSFLNELQDEVDELLNSNDDLTLSGIGVGAPMANSRTGIVSNAANLNWEGKVNLREFLQKRYQVPVFINNDANLAAVGEKTYGAAVGMQDFIVITLGTGLGGGIISNGELVQGPDSLAGEIGHITVRENGRHCGCGRKGCLETYVSSSGIKRTVYKLIADRNDSDSLLAKVLFKDLTSEVIYNAAMKGDSIAKEAFKHTGEILGLQLANLVMFTSPRAIFLVGGVANAGDLLFEPAKKSMESHLLRSCQNTVKLLPSKLDDNNVPILGASALVWESVDHMIANSVDI